MPERFRRRIESDRDRAVCARAVERAPLGFICEVREESRTEQQNRYLWPLLEDISMQAKWAGALRSPDDWKNLLVDAYRREVREYVPTLDGKGVIPLGGKSTSSMGVAEFSELLESIKAWGAENGVTFRVDPA